MDGARANDGSDSEADDPVAPPHAAAAATSATADPGALATGKASQARIRKQESAYADAYPQAPATAPTPTPVPAPTAQPAV